MRTMPSESTGTTSRNSRVNESYSRIGPNSIPAGAERSGRSPSGPTLRLPDREIVREHDPPGIELLEAGDPIGDLRQLLVGSGGAQRPGVLHAGVRGGLVQRLPGDH